MHEFSLLDNEQINKEEVVTRIIFLLYNNCRMIFLTPNLAIATEILKSVSFLVKCY